MFSDIEFCDCHSTLSLAVFTFLQIFLIKFSMLSMTGSARYCEIW